MRRSTDKEKVEGTGLTPVGGGMASGEATARTCTVFGGSRAEQTRLRSMTVAAPTEAVEGFDNSPGAFTLLRGMSCHLLFHWQRGRSAIARLRQRAAHLFGGGVSNVDLRETGVQLQVGRYAASGRRAWPESYRARQGQLGGGA